MDIFVLLSFGIKKSSSISISSVLLSKSIDLSKVFDKSKFSSSILNIYKKQETKTGVASRKRQQVFKIARLSAIFLGLSFFGMKGLLVGVVFNAWFSFFVNIYMVDKYIGYKIGRQLLDLLPVFRIAFPVRTDSFNDFGLGACPGPEEYQEIYQQEKYYNTDIY